MAASITINGVAGPLLTATAGQTITVNDVGGTATTWAWSLASRPPTSIASLVSPTSQTTTFVVDVEGTYLVQLIVDDALPTESEARTVVAVPSQTSAQRVPAVGETVESGARGWDTGAGSYLRLLDGRLENPGVVAGVTTGTLAQGTFVAIGQDPVAPVGSQSAYRILAAYPGARTLPLLYSGASIAVADVVGIALTTPSGSASTTANNVMLVRTSGIYQGFTLGSWASTDDYPYLYLTTAGAVVDVLPSAAVNIPPRIVGKVVRWYGAVRASACDIEVYGERRARQHVLTFGWTSTFTLSATAAYMSTGTGAPTSPFGGASPGQYPPLLPKGGQYVLGGLRVWCMIPTAAGVTTTFQVVNAQTLAALGAAQTLPAATNGYTGTGPIVAVDASVPLGIAVTGTAASTSPGQLTANLVLWEP